MKMVLRTITIGVCCTLVYCGIVFADIKAKDVILYDNVEITNKIITLGQPFNKESYARNVWDMQVLNGRIYLGHGNSSNGIPLPNAGPVPVIYLDPKTGQFINEYTVNEEQIDIFRVIDGKLYIPGHDARDSWDYGNYYVLNNGIWEKVRTIPAASHIFDLASFNGKLYTATGTEKVNFGEVMSSNNGGITWMSEMPRSGARFVTISGMAHTLFNFKGKLYAASEYVFPIDRFNNILVMDGTSSSVQKISGPGLMPGASDNCIYKMLRVTSFNDNLIYLGVRQDNALQWTPEALYVAPEINQAHRVNLPQADALPTDIVIRGDTVYVLAYFSNSVLGYTNLVYKSSDFANWSELFRFTSDTFARSFEELSGDFYFGLGCNTDSLPTSTGIILKVPYTAYTDLDSISL